MTHSMQPMNKSIEMLYHATFPDFAERIKTEGIAPNEQGVIHLTTNPFHSAGFIAMTGGKRWKGIETVITENKNTYNIPTFDTFNTCVVFGVHIESLKQDSLTISAEDFTSPFYPQGLTCYDYALWIPSTAIASINEYKVKDKNIPMQP